MTGKIYNTSKGWYLETKDNDYLPIYTKQEIKDLKIGTKVNYEIIEEENGGIGYSETYKLIKYAKII